MTHEEGKEKAIMETIEADPAIYGLLMRFAEGSRNGLKSKVMLDQFRAECPDETFFRFLGLLIPPAFCMATSTNGRRCENRAGQCRGRHEVTLYWTDDDQEAK